MEDITQLSRPEFFCENLKSITKMIKKEISVGSVTAKEYSFLLVHIWGLAGAGCVSSVRLWGFDWLAHIFENAALS